MAEGVYRPDGDPVTEHDDNVRELEPAEVDILRAFLLEEEGLEAFMRKGEEVAE